MKYYMILDIGGTKTTGAVFKEDGKPVNDYFFVTKSQTYNGQDAVYNNTIMAAQTVLKNTGINREDLIGVGVAAPGPLDYKTGVIIDVPMMGWHNFPLGQRLAADFGVPVCLDNDGNLGALAEQRVGVAKGAQNVLYMTVSTGCGGGVIINGELYHGHSGSAGEFGHMTLNYHGLSCGCGGSGCFELYASGTAMNRRMKRDMETGVKCQMFDDIGYDLDKISGEILADAAEKGDDYALDFWHQEGYYLGAGLANLFNLFDPDVLVLGGGVTKSHKWFHKAMMREIIRHACLPVTEDRIRYSQLNDKIVAYGAYCMIKEFTDKKMF